LKPGGRGGERAEGEGGGGGGGAASREEVFWVKQNIFLKVDTSSIFRIALKSHKALIRVYLD